MGDEEEGEAAPEAPRTIPYPPGVIPIYRSYPCKKKEEEKGEGSLYSHPCKQISISIPEAQEQPKKEEKNEKEASLPPEPPSKKESKEFKICALPYSRTWAQEKIEKRHSGELPKWFSQRREPVDRSKICPRELDDYEKNLRIPICKKEKKETECKEPIDGNLCVFCLGSLYLDGYIHDLFEKVPKIKKQSEKYGDDIAERIGIRTRITVHKKCYDDYIDFIKRKKDKEEEEEEEDEDETCEVKEENGDEDEDEMEGGKDQDKDKDKSKKGKRLKTCDLAKLPKKPHFCLKKFQIPKIGSGIYILKKHFINGIVDKKENGSDTN